MFDDPWTRDLTVLCDMANKDDRGAGLFRKTDQSLRTAAYLGYCPGRGIYDVRPHGLDRIDNDQTWRLAFRKSGDDVLDRGFGRKLDRGVAQTQSLCPQPYLRNRFLTR